MPKDEPEDQADILERINDNLSAIRAELERLNRKNREKPGENAAPKSQRPPMRTGATWLEDVIECFEAIGGQGHLSEIYTWFTKNKSHRVEGSSSWDGIIRRTIEQHSSDSDAFLGKKDFFKSTEGKGKGKWGLRVSKTNSDTGWLKEEIEVAVDAYCDMLRMERQGIKYNKAGIIRILRDGLNSDTPGPLARRSKGSVEMRMMNISSVLERHSINYVTGYKPMSNVGINITALIKARLIENGIIREASGKP